MKRVSRIRKVIVAGLGTLLVSVSMTSCGFLRTLLEKAIESQNTPAQTEQDAEGASDNLPDQAAQGEAGDASGQTNEAQLPEVNTGAKSATIMIYLNGSDLESEGGSATDDLVEMINSGIGKNVNVIIQTMGTKQWKNNKISGDTAQTWKIENDDLVLVRDNLGQLDCTEKDTLSEFVGFCGEAYPADRYLFIFWDHGGGPVYGFGYDEWRGDDASLTIDEMAEGFGEHPEIHFDLIGMDCCIMADLETCYALAPFCDYTVLSEDFESGLGWCYGDWMTPFEEDPAISTPVLGKSIIDSMVKENELSEMGDSSCIGLFKESAVQQLFADWMTYAYQNEDSLLQTNYSKQHMAKQGGRNGNAYWGTDGSDVTLEDYYISDMLAIVESVDNQSEAAQKLMKSLKSCVAYCGHTTDKNELTGMAISLPYGDSYFYREMKQVYGALGIDKDYIEWLGRFTSSSGADNYYDYDDFENSWEGWGSVEQECYGGCDSSEYYEEMDDWTYDYEDGLWYLYEDGVLYFYDEESDTMGYYDESDDTWYEDDSWYEEDGWYEDDSWYG